jgi:hypothetical protein
MPEPVELVDAWYFTCPECGGDSLVFPLTRDIEDPEEKRDTIENMFGIEDPTDDEVKSMSISDISPPKTVTCRFCKLTFPTSPIPAMGYEIQDLPEKSGDEENQENGESTSTDP